jgi:hypothetical protein
MSKERELLERWVSQFGNLRHDFNLLTETKELLAQPEQTEPEPIEDRIARWHKLGFEQGKKASQREPLIYEHLEALVDKYHGYPMTLGRAIEKAHGITGVDDEC